MKIISSRGKMAVESTVSDYARCEASASFFINNFVKQHNSTHGWFNLMLNAPQTRYIDALQYEQYVISKQPRGAGQTTSSLAFLLWRALYTANSTSLAVVPNSRMANIMSSSIRDMASFTPDHIRPRINRVQGQLEFNNGSRVQLVTSSDIVKLHGVAIDTAYIGDMSMMPLDEQLHTIHMMSSCVTPSGKLFIAATPAHAGDIFHTMWSGAKSGSRFVPIEVMWQEYLPASQYLRHVQQMSQEAVKRELDCEFI